MLKSVKQTIKNLLVARRERKNILVKERKNKEKNALFFRHYFSEIGAAGRESVERNRGNSFVAWDKLDVKPISACWEPYKYSRFKYQLREK